MRSKEMDTSKEIDTNTEINTNNEIDTNNKEIVVVKKEKREKSNKRKSSISCNNNGMTKRNLDNELNDITYHNEIDTNNKEIVVVKEEKKEKSKKRKSSISCNNNGMTKRNLDNELNDITYHNEIDTNNKEIVVVKEEKKEESKKRKSSISCNNNGMIIRNFDNELNDITYLANKKRKEEAVSNNELDKLKTLNVRLIHEVPRQHKIEVRSGTHAPTRNELEIFKGIIELKKGCFDPHEDKKIVHNWKKFCKLHDWNVKNTKAFLSLKDNGKYICKKAELKKFVQFLANGLPNRTLYSVYHRFRTLYSSHENRRYTQEENEMILTYMDQKQYVDEKRKFVDLAKVLNRSRASVWRHYRVLQKRRKNESDSD